ncbi:MAG TPA: DUF512 domain-containing protein [Nitrospirota bacterium]|nr:DUF512 domain-containing protein [Nitrospirota bacterium]
MLEIDAVEPGGIADGLGIKKGDAICTINRQPVNDVIDFKFLTAEEHLTLRIANPHGHTRIISLHKEFDDSLGLAFASIRVKRCRNKCIFCFVDQMPPGCRKSLSVKDDDYRASFLYGNYITLGSLSEQDWQRIFDLRLSPLYISVHATDPALRSFIIGNKKAPDILTNLRRLADGGIRMHTQIVLSPGINDGRFLMRTLDDLAGLYPSVISIAVVPVGLTSYRKNLYPLRTYTRREAREVIAMVNAFGNRLKKQFGSRVVYVSDEFYIKAQVPVPPAAYYEEFPQIENGVGMVADFLQNAARVRLPARIAKLSLTLVTGMSFANVLRDTAVRLKRVAGLTYRVVAARSFFFGSSVTVAGLLTAGDIAASLKGKRLGDIVLIPAESLREGDNVFLDDENLESLERKIGVPVKAVSHFRDLAAILRKAG